ncbi:hypothetical protein F4861DRAFT_110669 [Xylaria intraflava]|nr:hypothetical protein F4861DRAFT_110669 [Xylaria intraflava]
MEHRLRASFSDGSSEVGTLIVGTDGYASAVRRQLLPWYSFVDTGVCCVYSKNPLGPELCARLPEEYRKWITVVQGQTPMIQNIISGENPIVMVCEPFYMAQRNAMPDLPDDYIHWGILFRDDVLGLNAGERDEALKRDSLNSALNITSEWYDDIRSLIDLQDSALTSGMRVVSAPAKNPDWDASAHMTLLPR